MRRIYELLERGESSSRDSVHGKLALLIVF